MLCGIVVLYLVYREEPLQITTSIQLQSYSDRSPLSYDEIFFILMSVVSSRVTLPPSTGHEGSLSGLMCVKSLCYSPPETRSHLSWTAFNNFDRHLRQCSPTLSSKARSLGRMASKSVSENCRMYCKVQWRCSGCLCWPNTLIRHSVVVLQTQTFTTCLYYNIIYILIKYNLFLL